MRGARCHDAVMSSPTRSPLPFRFIFLSFMVIGVGCELPQDSADDGDSVDSDDAGDVTNEPRSWRLLKIIDRSSLDETTMPGLDVDAIVIFQDGKFLAAGCKSDPVLYESDTEGSSEVNEHADPSAGTLSAVDGETSSGGFISMASGVLTCELPVAVWTGSSITVIDVATDGDEAWEARLASDAAGDYEDAALGMAGTGEFTAP
jgi:hypothetical protein